MQNPANISARALALLIFLALSQGCSLLFVAKGGTQYVKGNGKKAPEAASQAKAMTGPIVVDYQVQEGETFPVVSVRFFGNTTKASKIARDNHLNPKSRLKTGKVLRIVNPAFFPGPEELARKIVLDQPVPKKGKGKGTPPAAVASSVPTVEPTPDEIDKVPRPRVNHVFGPGEKLKFEIRALSILGGYATLEVEDYTTVAGRPCVPLVVHANSVFPLTGIYPVDDVQTSYFDTVDFLTWKFQNNVHEGDWKARNLEVYDQVRHTMTRQHNDEKPFEMGVPPFTQDIISCFYYFRLLPFEEGKTYEIPTQSSGQNYHLYVKVLEREKVTVPAGTFDCFRVKPLVKKDTVFRTKEAIDIWVTADDRHMPVKVQTGIVIGSIDADLLDAKLPPLNH